MLFSKEDFSGWNSKGWIAAFCIAIAAASYVQHGATSFAWQQTASSWGSRAGFPIAKLAGNVPGLSGFIFLESGDYLHLGMTLSYQTSNPPAGLQAPPGTVFTLSESRRVKWDQLNYYDHPAFGVVALVTPADRGTGGR